MFKVRFLLGLTIATLIFSVASLGPPGRASAQVQSFAYPAVLTDGRPVGDLVLGQTTLEQAVRMFPPAPPGYGGNPRPPRGFPEVKIGQVSPKPALVHNPWMTLYLLFFDAIQRLVIVVDGGKSRFRGLSQQEMLKQYPQLKEMSRDSLEYEMQVEVQPCVTLMLLISVGSNTVGDIAYVFTCPTQSGQTPTEPESMNERKIFELHEPTSSGTRGLLRIAWVDETTILATIEQPPGLQVKLINIATGGSQEIGQGGCASLSPDRSRVAWVRGPGHTPTGDVWILEFRSMQAQQLTINAVQEGDPALGDLMGGTVRATCLTWSPEGRRLAITTGGVLSRGPLLIVAVANGQVQSKVQSQGLMLGYPAWSPDGERLAFTSETVDYEVDRIDTFDFRRGVRSKLVDVPSKYGAKNLIYSPDGRDLLFDADFDKIYAFDGSRLRRLVAGWSPTWLPDRSLTLVRGNSIYVVGR